MGLKPYNILHVGLKDEVENGFRCLIKTFKYFVVWYGKWLEVYWGIIIRM